MEEEGSWPRLGLLLLPGVVVGWLVLCSLALFVSDRQLCITCPLSLSFLVGFIDQPTQGYNGNMPSWWVHIDGVRDAGLGPA